MKKLLLIGILIMAAQLCWGNPLPEANLTEYSTDPVWIELNFSITTDISGLIINTLEGDAVVDSPTIASGFFIIDSTNCSNLHLNPEGDQIIITQFWIYCYFGNRGFYGVPPLSGESAQVTYSDSRYNFNESPTPGQFRLSPAVRWGERPFIINEISAHGTWRENCGYIELYNASDNLIDISGYQIICNARYEVPPNTRVRPHKFYVIDQARFPSGFGMPPEGDNVYLLNNSGELIDQVGWSSDHQADVSFMRYPDGNVQWDNFYDFCGYDDGSSYTFSEGFPTRRAFNRIETPGLSILGIDADTSGGLVNLYWTDPIWQTVFGASIVRKSLTGFPAGPFDGDLVYEGTDQQYLGDTVAPGQTAYYTVFARTGCGQYSTPDSESQISVFMPASEIGGDTPLPENADILKAYPNPFNSTALLSYIISRPGLVNISIFNIAGQRVAEVLDGNREAGEFSLEWNASGYPSGVYFARMRSNGGITTAKLLLLK